MHPAEESSHEASDAAVVTDAAPRWFVRVGALAAGSLAALKMAPLTFVDPDVFHQLSLAREIWLRGSVPSEDLFAYTSTVSPLVHHEWGAGLLWLGVGTLTGAAGFLSIKYALVAALLALAVRAARARGAGSVELVLTALPAVYLAHYGFTTIRAQLLTLVALALLLGLLANDESGRRRWIAGWLLVHVVWVNVHAGFVVGLGFLGLTTLERAARREPFLHLAATTACGAGLTLVNPWGFDYVSYLVHGLGMDRSQIAEWAPLWVDLRRRWVDLAIWFGMLAMTAYTVRTKGVRACRGVSLVSLSLVFALLHQRHVTLLAVTWFAFVPAWLSGTPLADRLRHFVGLRARLLTALAATAVVLWLSPALLLRPWELRLPADLAARAEGWPTYPIGAADYLREQGFQGNLMTPFIQGAYMMWRLQPQGVRVSLDGRFEAAYEPAVFAAHTRFYAAEEGWSAVLGAHPTDLVLVPRDTPVISWITRLEAWKVVYGDDLYVLVARDDSPLPFVDRRGRSFHAPFP